MTRRRFTVSRLLMRLRKVLGNDQLIVSILALVVGAAGGGAVILFREGIVLVQTLAYGSGTDLLYEHAGRLPWWHVVLAPSAGGLLIGLLVHYFMPGRRPHGVADVIEASALLGGRMSLTTGVRAALVSAASLGVGASAGREGPAVHLGASLGGWLASRLHLTQSLARTLVGCGVATAVAASFNAPIAGALFANEVVIGHYALRAFAPVVIASVTGTAISRVYFGDFPAFAIAEHPITSLWEFPAFVGLGIAAGVTAAVFMHAVMLAETAAGKVPVRPWLRPVFGGMIVGLIALVFPQVLGVGYGPTNAALATTFPLWLLVAVGAAKLLATAISLGFGFGGGVFSPSLVIGAMLGGAYGMVATQVFPDLSSGPGAYTLVGMGAMAAAVLGAPISTTLIVFELTGDYALTMGVMLAVVVSSVITRQVHGHTFFTWQLERRGLDLKGGYEAALLRTLRVRDAVSRTAELVTQEVSLPEVRAMLQRSEVGELFVLTNGGALFGTITLADLSDVAFDHAVDDLVNAGDVARLHPPVLCADDDFDTALKLMRQTGEQRLAVVEDTESMAFFGCVHQGEVMEAYNRALLQVRREERGD